jgi:4-aminobutyrate aminotransferase-like enzyme
LSALTFERWALGTGKVLLGNSGFEAVEAALKTSLLHSGLPGVIAFTGGYHGLGLGALATTELPFFREPFRAQLKDFATFLPYPHCFRCPFGVREDYRLEGRDFPNCATTCLEQIHDQIEETIRKREIGCILVEPVQGRGGCVVPPRDFLPILRTICDTHKILLIADEIYTGFNRTGALFACDHSNVTPDIICLGKALTGGFHFQRAWAARISWTHGRRPPRSTAHEHLSGQPPRLRHGPASLAQHADSKTAAQVFASAARS